MSDMSSEVLPRNGAILRAIARASRHHGTTDQPSCKLSGSRRASAIH